MIALVCFGLGLLCGLALSGGVLWLHARTYGRLPAGAEDCDKGGF